MSGVLSSSLRWAISTGVLKPVAGSAIVPGPGTTVIFE